MGGKRQGAGGYGNARSVGRQGGQLRTAVPLHWRQRWVAQLAARPGYMWWPSKRGQLPTAAARRMQQVRFAAAVAVQSHAFCCISPVAKEPKTWTRAFGQMEVTTSSILQGGETCTRLLQLIHMVWVGRRHGGTCGPQHQCDQDHQRAAGPSAAPGSAHPKPASQLLRAR